MISQITQIRKKESVKICATCGKKSMLASLIHHQAKKYKPLISQITQIKRKESVKICATCGNHLPLNL